MIGYWLTAQGTPSRQSMFRKQISFGRGQRQSSLRHQYATACLRPPTHLAALTSPPLRNKLLQSSRDLLPSIAHRQRCLVLTAAITLWQRCQSLQSHPHLPWHRQRIIRSDHSLLLFIEVSDALKQQSLHQPSSENDVRISVESSNAHIAKG